MQCVKVIESNWGKEVGDGDGDRGVRREEKSENGGSGLQGGRRVKEGRSGEREGADGVWEMGKRRASGCFFF